MRCGKTVGYSRCLAAPAADPPGHRELNGAVLLVFSDSPSSSLDRSHSTLHKACSQLLRMYSIRNAELGLWITCGLKSASALVEDSSRVTCPWRKPLAVRWAAGALLPFGSSEAAYQIPNAHGFFITRASYKGRISIFVEAINEGETSCALATLEGGAPF